ncbi:MAG TPA: hypothetical protein ENN80_03325, partial [Candidatus Hydrogenedentes bacterium]|nr:hypothetical protein [Candidatus Hydrogenedentota bacterium]
MCLKALALALVYVFWQPAWAQAPDVEYEVSIRGIESRDLREALRDVSDAVGLRGRVPASMALLRRRVERDVSRFVDVLKARGYYGASVQGDIDKEKAPIQVLYYIDPGPRYTLVSAKWVFAEGKSASVTVPELSKLGLAVGEPTRVASVLDSERALLRSFKRQGFPFPEILTRRIEVNHAERTVAVRLEVDPGPHAVFGATTFAGLDTVQESLLRDYIPWREGNVFNNTLLTRYQGILTATNLFSVALVSTADEVDDAGRLPI